MENKGYFVGVPRVERKQGCLTLISPFFRTTLVVFYVDPVLIVLSCLVCAVGKVRAFLQKTYYHRLLYPVKISCEHELFLSLIHVCYALVLPTGLFFVVYQIYND